MASLPPVVAATLDELEEAVDLYADQEQARIDRRVRQLEAMNTRIDDFALPVESEQVRRVLLELRALGV